MMTKEKTVYINFTIAENDREPENDREVEEGIKFGAEKFPLSMFISFNYYNLGEIEDHLDFREDVLKYSNPKCETLIVHDTKSRFHINLHFQDMDSTVSFINSVLDKYNLKNAFPDIPALETPEIESTRLLKLEAHKVFNSVNRGLN